MQDDPRRWRRDITTRYSFVEDRLIYNDAPIAGYLVCRECTSVFMFQRQQQGQASAWLWRLVLVPTVRSKEDDEDLLKIDLDQLARGQGCAVIELLESDSDGGRVFEALGSGNETAA
jgi:hypothetical protein